MQDFNNKVAVITGAASGIGYALTAECLARGMHVVMADVEESALDKAVQVLQGEGFNSVLPVVTNVAIKQEIENLAEKAVAEFGAVHLLFNNAGVGAGAGATTSYDDWEWVIGVNLWSVIYGIKTFLPIMESQESECHIVNTASVAGLVYGNGSAPYAVTKHGVVALTETVYLENAAKKSNTGMSVLCPGFTATNIMESGRNRPEDLQQETEFVMTPEIEAGRAAFRKMVDSGLAPAELAKIVFQGIIEKKLYILTSEDFDQIILQRAQHITDGTNPQLG